MNQGAINPFPGGRFQADVPSVHHRFNKESVHLRSMYRQLYPSHKNSGYFNAEQAIDSDDSDVASRGQNQLRKNNLAKAGQGHITASAGQAARKSSVVVGGTERTSPIHNKLNILQNTPA